MGGSGVSPVRGFISALLGAVLSLLFTTPALAVTTPVGTTPGSFSVNPNGGANYSIPITAPPGTAGLTPSISLNYDRQVKSELLGVGWSIGGLSLIQRCGSTIAIDGQKGGVNYDTNDKYCLDGQRLIAISGTYGADGTEYRTERETFQKIISYGTQGNGPASFKAWGKDGTVREYGITEDARIEAQGKTTVRLWALNRIQDLRSNYLTVTYVEDNTNGEYRPTRIDYTGNTAVGLSPYNSVRFTYAAKPDISSQYQSGSLIKTTQRLTKVESYADANVVRTYNLSYDNNGTPAGATYTPLTQTQFQGWTWATNGRRVDDNSLLFMADVNGDGKKDFVDVAPPGSPNAGAVHVGLSTGASFEGWTSVSASRLDANSTVMFGDVNGDGKEDLVFITGPTGNVPGRAHIGLSNGTGFNFWTWNSPGRMVEDGSRVFLADVNGDGKKDLVAVPPPGSPAQYPGRIHVGLSNGTSFEQWTGVAGGIDFDGQVLIGDVNGDGKEDFVAVATASPNTGAVVIGLANGLSFNTWTWMSATRLDAGSTVLLSDVNGDGKKDLVVVSPPGTSNAGAVHVGLSDGVSFAAWTSISSNRLDAGTIVQMGDVNADGKGDLVAISNPGGKVHIGLSNGSGFQFWSWDTGGRRVDDGSTNFVADVNGDGKADHVAITGTSGSYPGGVHIGLSIQATIGQQESASIGSTRLISVAECGADGVCLPATAFNWQNPADPALSVGWTMPDGRIWRDGFPQQTLPVDVNGDGVTDLVQIMGDDPRFQVLLGARDGSFNTSQYSTEGISWRSGIAKAYAGDVNGDGRTDIIQVMNGDARLHTLLAQPNGTYTVGWESSTSGSWHSDIAKTYVLDVNGDGRADLVQIMNDEYRTHVMLGQPDGSFSVAWECTSCGPWREGMAQQKFAGDFNGDGRMDLAQIMDGDGRITIMYGKPDGSLSNDWGSEGGLSWQGSIAATYTGDFNGDGKTDLLQVKHDSYEAQVLLSKGDGLVLAWTAPDGRVWRGGVGSTFVGDVNGDGKADIIQLVNYDARVKVLLGRGDGSFSITWENNDGRSWYTNIARTYAADFNGDGKTDLLQIKNDPVNPYEAHTLLAQGLMPDQLIGATTGLGATTAITYKPLTDSSVYTKDSGSVYPYQDAQAPIYVVSRVTQSDGLGGSYGVSYHYTGAKAHLTGGGWLGFRIMKTTDERSGVVSQSYFNQTYNGTHSTPAYSETLVNGVVVKRQDHYWTPVSLGGGRAYGKLDGTLEQTFELNGTPVTCVSVNMTYDTFGNVLTSVAKSDTACSFTAPFTKTTSNTYLNDQAAWRLGQLLSAQVTSEAPNTQALTRSSSFTYQANGLIASETVEPNTSLSLTTSYTYDGFGNRTGTTVSGPDITSRTSTATYDTRGRYAIAATNALGHSATTTYDPVLNLPVSVTDANGLSASVTYDGLGRKLTETKPDGTITTHTYAACDASCPALAAYKLTTTPTGGSAVTSYHDILGRAIRKESRGFNNEVIYQDVQHDTLGRVAQTSHPYFVAEAIHWDVRTFDALGRVTVLTEADGGITQSTYAGLTTTITNPLGQTGISLKDAAGRLKRATDALGNYTTYNYDALGNLTQVTDAAGNLTTMAYDLRGRKTAMNDPDMGSWNYSYNTLGELISQTDAKGQVTSMQYDVLGRLTNRTNAEGITTWTYDSAGNGIGKLATVSSPDFQETYTYDSLGRPNQVATSIHGDTFTTATSYDAISRVDTITYPTGFATKNIYNNQGYLTELKNAANNNSFWQASAADAHARLTQETYGNGLTSEHLYDHEDGSLVAIRTTGPLGIAQDLSYSFDLVGNLKTRTDTVQAYTETFTYDGINRLTQVSGPAPKTYQYDAIGNITYKSDVGTYLYGQGGTKPHAVTQAGTNTYTYDANGNQISGAGRTITYTSFNKPSQITTSTTTVNFSYDANQRRMRKVSSQSTTVYLGKLYEKTTSTAGAEHKHYLYAANTLVGIHTHKPDATTNTRYIHTDHLLSVDTVTDEAGNVVSRMSYDAHGKRRNINGTDATTPITSSVTRGFTRHEMDDDVGLINMNAREYDPVLGRFLTPDTFVQYPQNTQGFNRYTYVNNNPLSYTDPSGHFLGSIIREVSRAVKDVVNEVKRTVDHLTSSDGLRTIVAAVAAYYTAGAMSAWMTESAIAAGSSTTFASVSVTSDCIVTASLTVPGQVVAGAAAGFAGGGVSGGDAKSAWRGATGGAIFGGVNAQYGKAWGWERLAANSMAGGVTAEIYGGKFKQGFAASFLTGSAKWAYTSQVGYDPKPIPGENRPDQTTYQPGLDGRLLPEDQTMNIVGKNLPLAGDFWADLGKQSGPLSKFLNVIPGINATGGLHDYWFNKPDHPAFTAINNVGTMLPAAAVTYGALLDGPIGVFLAIDHK